MEKFLAYLELEEGYKYTVACEYTHGDAFAPVQDADGDIQWMRSSDLRLLANHLDMYEHERHRGVGIP